jgi:hypothetical protein
MHILGYGETKGHKAYHLYEKIEKSVILKIDVTFNEIVMVLKERKPILDASIYDLIKGQNEGFMPLNFNVDEHILIPHVVPILGSPKVSNAPDSTPTIVPSTPPCLPMKFIIIEILFILPFKLDFQNTNLLPNL